MFATVETPPWLVKRKFTCCDYSCQLWPINLNWFAGFPKKKWCHPQHLLGSEISLELNAVFPVVLSLLWGSLIPVYVWRGLLSLLEFSQVNCLPLSGGFWILVLRETWSPREKVVLNIQKSNNCPEYAGFVRGRLYIPSYACIRDHPESHVIGRT